MEPSVTRTVHQAGNGDCGQVKAFTLLWPFLYSYLILSREVTFAFEKMTLAASVGGESNSS